MNGNNATAIQSLDDRVTAELASKLDSSALAPAIAPLATAAALATTDGQVAAHGSSIAALQSSLTTGLSNKADQSAFDVLEGVVATKSTPDGVDLKLSNYSTTAAMNGSIASANNATLATVAANYGLKTVVDQHSLDIAARITPLEVDTKVANALLGAVTAAALASELTWLILPVVICLSQRRSLGNNQCGHEGRLVQCLLPPAATLCAVASLPLAPTMSAPAGAVTAHERLMRPAAPCRPWPPGAP